MSDIQDSARRKMTIKQETDSPSELKGRAKLDAMHSNNKRIKEKRESMNKSVEDHLAEVEELLK